MPKSNPAASPSTVHHLQPKHASDEPSSRLSDVALRKKKNADAQAAFRARRANYIATLEETGSIFSPAQYFNYVLIHFLVKVTSLESVVLQLQDSCRESRHETQELRQENTRLRQEFRDREKVWRTLWQSRKADQGVGSDDVPPLPPPSIASHLQTSNMNPHIGSTQIHQYAEDDIAFRANESSACQVPFPGASANHGFPAPPLPYAEPDHAGDGASLNHRPSKYDTYPYPMAASGRDGRWHLHSSLHQTGSGGDQSPTLTTSEPFSSRFSGDEQKVALNSALDTAPYAFPNGERYGLNVGDSMPNSRSMSPTSSTPGSSSSTLAPPFQFTFPDTALGQERPDFDYRRHSLPHGTEVTLHGGTADISLTGPAADVVRYRVGSRRFVASGDDRQLLPSLRPLSGSETGSQHDKASSDGDSTPYINGRRRARRDTLPSRSPSPIGPAPLSCTVAVIKAQAFGALRRTRARTKKSSEGAAKVAMDVLEARGIGIGVPPGGKRQRIVDDDSLLES
jgi:hypothetical protein